MYYDFEIDSKNINLTLYAQYYDLKKSAVHMNESKYGNYVVRHDGKLYNYNRRKVADGRYFVYADINNALKYKILVLNGKAADKKAHVEMSVKIVMMGEKYKLYIEDVNLVEFNYADFKGKLKEFKTYGNDTICFKIYLTVGKTVKVV